MKLLTSLFATLALIAGLGVSGTASAQDSDSLRTTRWTANDHPGRQALEFLEGRLEIGLRTTRFSLDTTQSPGTDREIPGQTFLGNLTRMTDQQDSSPKLFITILPIPYVGLQIDWDGVEARAWNVDSGPSDGNVKADGHVISLLLQYPNQTRFTPYASLGETFWDSTFNEDGWWRYGFSSPERYEEEGRPREANHGLQRYITTSINNGSVLTLGLGIRILEHLSADIMYRETSVDVDAEYYRQLGSVSQLRRTGNFPLDHSSYGVGVKYVF